jgi:2Fe-2S ferredoxin
MNTVTLTSRKGTYQLIPDVDRTIVELAKSQKIPWGYACERGICAQCRTRVIEGAQYLNDFTEAEKLRLRKTERLEGYRLGCQIRIKAPGTVSLLHAPY